MTTSIIVCAGGNASSRSNWASTMRSRTCAVVIDASDANSLRIELQPFRSAASFRVMLQYFLAPDLARLLDPEGWWDRVSSSIGRPAPGIARKASAKANINEDTGGGSLQFTWKQIPPTNWKATAGSWTTNCELLADELGSSQDFPLACFA